MGRTGCLSPSQRLNLSYGYLWWLNGQPTYLLPDQQRPSFPGPLIENGPADLVAALGKDDQKLYISRELEAGGLPSRGQGRHLGCRSALGT